MNSNPKSHWNALTNLLALIALACAALAGCGGGSSSDGDAPSMTGTRLAASITSRTNGTNYALSIYLPPVSAGPRSSLPIVYALDGEGWFETIVGAAQSTHTQAIVVGIGTSGQRGRDFVPSNSCTSNGGGHVAYLDFLRNELLPYVEANFGGSPQQRALFGHSHGGSFVLYAMFAQQPGQHAFKAYLASDASVSCMPDIAGGWEQDYARTYRELPVRLHLSYATQGGSYVNPNLEYARVIKQRNYSGLAFVDTAYSGSHSGIVPQVLNDAVPYAFAAGQ